DLPTIDDSKIADEIQQTTLNTYVASKFSGKGKGGKLGKGGGTQGGWPEGMEGAEIRFIRLEYDGDWTYRQGTDSDYNLLLAFRDITSFKIAPATEHIPI